MTDTLTFRDLFAHSARDVALLSSFLECNGLRYENDIEGGTGAFSDGTLVACGCFSGNILKCFAVSPALRGENVLGAILSRVVATVFQRGHSRLSVYTKPGNKAFFEASGFYAVCETDQVALLENTPDGPDAFARAVIAPEDAGREGGAIVMNCNPFTRGHRHLVEHASGRSEIVYLFVVEEDKSVFPFAVRQRLVREGVADLPNVRVLGSGPYIISAATFPTYFLKQPDEAALVQAELDATLFARRIAPAFGIRRRYFGQEPFCPLTLRYNKVMETTLPRFGIEVEEIPRLAEGGTAISASEVRRHIREHGVDADLASLVPKVTLDFLRSPGASSVIEAITRETRVE